MIDKDYTNWDGGDQPKETIGRLVNFRMRENGSMAIQFEADHLRWKHIGSGTDIVSYRVVGEEKNTTALDKQVGGEHYKDKTIQPVEYIHANGLGFCEGNVVKYITRWRDKNGIADLEKAKHYIELLIELEQKSKT